MHTQRSSQPEVELKSALDVLETSIATPIVAGDLATWIDDVKNSWSHATAQIEHHIDDLHPRQFDQIVQQDPELLPRVDALKAEDASIRSHCRALGQTVARLAQHVPSLEPDEEKAMKFTKGFVDEATQFIARVRKQAVALQTWYVEAFQRDRGAVD
jgi:hypothetical protein